MPLPSPPRRAFSQITPLLAGIIAIGALYFARVVFVPLVLAVLFAFLLTPAVTFLDKLHLPRVASALCVVLVSVVIVGLLGWVATNQLIDVATQLPGYRANIERKLDWLGGAHRKGLASAAVAVTELRKELIAPPQDGTQPPATNGENNPPPEPVTKANPLPVEVVPPTANPLESLNTLVGPLTVFGMVTIFTLFILIGREDLRNRIFRLVGHRHLTTMTQVLDDASKRVSRYLSLQLTVNIVYGLIVGTGLYFIGIPQAFLWGLITSLLRFLPYLGFWISASLPVLLSFAIFDGWLKPALAIALYGTVEIISANLVEPMLYGAHIGLSPLAILVSAVFWTILWGPIGLVISTPLTVCLVVVGRYVPSLHPISILLGDEEVMSPELQFYQRLLAADPYEAKQVLDKYLEDHSLDETYDAVVIPALALAEQEGRHNELDETSHRLLRLSSREIIDELQSKANGIAGNHWDQADAGHPNRLDSQAISAHGRAAACVPAQNDADEVVGCMLAQLAERRGCRCECLSLGPLQDSIAAIQHFKPDVVCISALPPFGVSHAGNLYRHLCSILPEGKVLVGLWNFPGDPSTLAKRLRLRGGDKIVMSLRAAMEEINPPSALAEAPDQQPPDQDTQDRTAHPEKALTL